MTDFLKLVEGLIGAALGPQDARPHQEPEDARPSEPEDAPPRGSSHERVLTANFPGPIKLDVSTLATGLVVVGDDVPRASVRVTIEGEPLDARHPAFEAMELRQDGDRLILRLREDGNYTSRGGVSIQTTNGVTTVNGVRAPKYVISALVPSGSEVKFDCSSGYLETQGDLGHVTANIVSGSVRIATAASVRAVTESGSIHVERSLGTLYANTMAGSIKIQQAFGGVIAKTMSGGITIRDGDGVIDANTMAGSIFIRYRGEKPRVRTMAGSKDVLPYGW